MGMMIRILPAYFRMVLEEVEKGALVDRQLIQEMKFLCEICKKDRRVRDALEMLGASVAALFPLDLLEKAASVRVQRFLVSDWL